MNKILVITDHKAGKWALWWFNDNMLISSIRLSNFNKARFAPIDKWRAIIKSIVEFLAERKSGSLVFRTYSRAQNDYISL